MAASRSAVLARLTLPETSLASSGCLPCFLATSALIVIRAVNTGTPRLAGLPAHVIPASNREQLRPIPVDGTAGLRQPNGTISATSCRGYGCRRPPRSHDERGSDREPRTVGTMARPPTLGSFPRGECHIMEGCDGNQAMASSARRPAAAEREISACLWSLWTSVATRTPNTR